jgi:hypothetical protein
MQMSRSEDYFEFFLRAKIDNSLTLKTNLINLFAHNLHFWVVNLLLP